ncbi:MAG TPA: ABC transporter permease subunit, partial [Bacteroidales bacterium]|nr:ABC transporter permease subunit [Bacteroidales bacterium]
MDNKPQVRQFEFTRESLKKKFRWSEFLSEKIITGVAFLSITIIVLIFVFVFRESIPLFIHAGKNVSPSGTLQQEQYGAGATTSTSGQETYGVDTVPVNESGQEQYGVEAPVTNASGQEQYGVTASDSAMTGSQPEETASGEDHEQISPVRSLAGNEWMPISDRPRYGLIPLFVGTLKITLIAILFAAPIAILAALFTASFASPRMREIVKPAIELLAGFPSVVIGFFALMVMATVFQQLFGYATRLNAFVGGVAMALAAIPIIYTITEDALSAVPKTFTEASLALGASKWQTALFVILPAATPGIFAAVLARVDQSDADENIHIRGIQFPYPCITGDGRLVLAGLEQQVTEGCQGIAVVRGNGQSLTVGADSLVDMTIL